MARQSQHHFMLNKIYIILEILKNKCLYYWLAGPGGIDNKYINTEIVHIGVNSSSGRHILSIIITNRKEAFYFAALGGNMRTTLLLSNNSCFLY